MEDKKQKTYGMVLAFGVVVVLTGILIGILFTKLYTKVYNPDGLSKGIQTYFLSLNSETTIAYDELFQYIIIRNGSQFLFFWLLMISPINRTCLIGLFLYYGFEFGFLGAAFFMQFSLKGVGIFLLILFPQYLVYIPIYIVMFLQGYSMAVETRYFTKPSAGKRLKLFLHKLPIIGKLGAGMILGSILEAFFNSILLKKVFPFLFP